MTHRQLIWCALCWLVFACNGEKKPETPATSVSTSAPPTPTSAPTPASSASAAGAPTATGTVAAPTVTCNAKETAANKKRDTKARGRENRIVGGKPAPLGNWPYAVALAMERNGKLSQYCGASLIGKGWVLTAAHCQVIPGEKAIVGRRDLSKNDGEVISVARVLNHALYDPETNDNDVAVLQLSKEVDRELVALFDGTSDLAGDKSTVVGWGLLTEGGQAPSALQEVEVPIVANQVCKDGYASDSVGISDNMLCAGVGQGGKDSCQGDSGGPLLVKGSGASFRQAGIVSFGIGCARPGKYGVYTRVSKFAGWIQACTKS